MLAAGFGHGSGGGPGPAVTIPAPDWYGEVGGGTLFKNDRYEPPDGAGMIIFAQPEYIVYGDACHWTTMMPASPVTTVDEFVTALSSQASRDASEAVDITLGGYVGKSVTLEVPDDVDFSDCDPGYGGSWSCGGEARPRAAITAALVRSTRSTSSTSTV